MRRFWGLVEEGDRRVDGLSTQHRATVLRRIRLQHSGDRSPFNRQTGRVAALQRYGRAGRVLRGRNGEVVREISERAARSSAASSVWYRERSREGAASGRNHRCSYRIDKPP